MALDPLSLMNAVKALSGAVRDLFPKHASKERDELKFLCESLKELQDNPGMHPYARASTLQHISGSVFDSPEVIEYVLNLQAPLNALGKFRSARSLLEHNPADPQRQLVFREKYADEHKRKRVNRRYDRGFLLGIIGCGLVPSIVLGWNGFAALGMVGPFFQPWHFIIAGELLAIPVTILCAMESIQRYKAEVLVAEQKPYPATAKPPELRRLTRSSRPALPNRR